MIAYLNILTAVLLALVAGLLLALWFQLRDWRKHLQEAPLLAEQLAEQLLSARNGLEELKKSLLAHGPELSRLLSEGGKLRVELELLLQRGEQMARKLDQPVEVRRVDVIPTVEAAAVVEEVAGANGHAIQPARAARDPLEDLLAGLQQYEEDSSPIAKSPAARPAQPARRKRSGPVTQAELDLQRKVAV